MIDRSQRVAARVFAVTYPLTFVIIFVAFYRFYAPFLDWANGAETAGNLVQNEHSLRVYLALSFLYGVGGVVMLSALYVVLRPINRGLALFATFCNLIYVSMWFVQLLEIFDALRIMSGGIYSLGLEPNRLQALASLQLASGGDAYYIGLTFYSLGIVFFSVLFFQSRYVPRALAVFGILASLFEGFCGFAYLIDRNFGAIVSPDFYELPVMLFQLTLSVWILIRGLRPLETAKAIAASS